MKQLENTFELENNKFTQVKRSDKAALYKRETLEGQFVSYEVFAIRTKNDVEIYPNKTAFGRGVTSWAFCPMDLKRADVYYDRFEKVGEKDGFEPTWIHTDPETGEIIPEETPTIENVEVSLETPKNEQATDITTSPEPDIVQPPQPEQPMVQVTPDGGAVVTVAKVTKTQKVLPTFKFPKGEWTRTDFALLNNLKPCNSESYSALMREIKAGRAKEVRKDKSGKGKPRSIYTTV